MNFYLSPPSVSQYIACEVFDYYHYFDKVVKKYLVNRNTLVKSLKGIGLNDYVLPSGAFYLYVNISSVHKNSYDFCKKLVEDVGVTIAPGIDFDHQYGKKFIRISYSCKKNELEKALKLIKNWI